MLKEIAIVYRLHKSTSTLMFKQKLLKTIYISHMMETRHYPVRRQ